MEVRRPPGPRGWVAARAQAVFSQWGPAPPSPAGRAEPSLAPPAGLGQELLGSCRLGSSPGCSAGCTALPPDPSFELPASRIPLAVPLPRLTSVAVCVRGPATCPGYARPCPGTGDPPRPGVWPLSSLPTAGVGGGTTESYSCYLGPRADTLPRLLLGTAGSRQARSKDRAWERKAQRGFPGWQGPREQGGLWTSSLKWGLQPLSWPRAPWTPSLG